MKPELLIPINSFAGLEACKKYADAVYFGASALDMRARKKGFELKDMPNVVKACHKNKTKAYLTLNSVIYNEDVPEMKKVMNRAKKAGVDAVIVWDISAIEYAGKIKLPFHISTQANVSNVETAKFYKDLGAERIILARELSLEQIKNIRKNVDVKIETFVHGAMCVSISGRCYLSAYLFGKSANCGECIQPCRREWILKDVDGGGEIVCDGKHLLSAKDLCVIEHIPELIESGIGAFKIEGRLRDTRYIETVSKCYREAIDSYFGGTFSNEKVKSWLEDLKKVYNRGFSTGFYFGNPTGKDFSYDKSDSQATEKRTQVGIVTNYFPKQKVAAVKILSGNLKTGDNVIIEGHTTYFHDKVSSIRLNEKSVKKVIKGDVIGLKVNKKCRKNDWVYIIDS